ncbi:unnamed protein product [Dracunculus medinensis]|uniref:Tetraspanin n=1 Tax=Dracunculus medinensis TaxID=318479 RepID=A0A0N4UNW9_DRAME|nr:unnamed protein product [Dracunculus medinensis]
MSNLIAALTAVAFGILLFSIEDEWRQLIRTNLQYSIQKSIENNEFADEINRIQSLFQCCGLSVNGSEPKEIWLTLLKVDMAFKNELFRPYKMLPWSCCRHNHSYCDHLAFERYYTQINANVYKKWPSYTKHINEKWECGSLENCKNKRKLAQVSLNNRDCSESFVNSFQTVIFHWNGSCAIVLGLQMLFTSITAFFFELTDARANYQ